MRKNVRAFVELSEEIFDLKEPVYEFGAYQMSGQEEAADLRPIFKMKKYIGCDARQGKGVDRVEDVQSMTLPDASAGSVILVDTIEHVKKPENALREIHRILKPGGIVVMASVMDFPIHHHPYDYWRFTPEGFRSLLEIFDKQVVGWQGEAIFPHTIFGIGFKAGSSADISQRISKFCDNKDRIHTAIAFKPWKKKMSKALLNSSLLKKDSFLKDSIRRYAFYDEISFINGPEGGARE